MNKIMSMHEAIDKYVHSGDTIAFGGFTTNRKPYAAVSEIIRQGKGDFILWAGPAGGESDMLVGTGRIKLFINCYTANSGFSNVLRRYRAAIEKGTLPFEDYSQDVVMLQFHAAALGLPFLPVKLMQGSDLAYKWGLSREQRENMPGVDNLKLVEMENPFNQREKVLAVPVPRLDCAIIHCQKASPDGTLIIEGDEFHDVDLAIAAERVIATCEEIVTEEYMRSDPEKPNVFSACVDAVVHAPYGAWPSQCYGYYDDDVIALREYDRASRYQNKQDAEEKLRSESERNGIEYVPCEVETFDDYVEKYVWSVSSHDELLEKLGTSRLLSLKNVPGLGYANGNI